MRRLVASLSVLIGVTLIGQGSYLTVKAWVAQQLIAYSWVQRDGQSAVDEPWPWADTRVVGKLVFPNQNQTQFVMDSTSGQALAFGPGHLPNSSRISERGHTVIAAHRDTHFELLQHTQIGDPIETESVSGIKMRYRVTDLAIVDTDEAELHVSDSDQLWLITCYPFDDLVPGGPLRYIVVAEPEQ